MCMQHSGVFSLFDVLDFVLSGLELDVCDHEQVRAVLVSTYA